MTTNYQQPVMGYGSNDRQQYPYNNVPYNNYMGQQQFQPVQTNYLKCRPVASKEEAMACQIDLDGSLWVFTDVMNGKIYTKQINNDGTATFNTYLYTKETPQINNS